MTLGNLVFFAPHDPWGRLVAWGTRAPVSHVGIDWGDGTYLSAQSWGVAFARLADPYARATLGARLLALPEGPAALDWLARLVGTKYSWPDVLIHVVKALWPGCPWTIEEPKRWDCSALVTAALIRAGWPDLPDAFLDAPHLVTPGDLYLWCRDLGVLTR